MKKNLSKKNIRVLRTVVRKYIRMRDNNCCCMCLKPVSGRNSQISHIHPKETYKHLEFDEYNLVLMCFRCHKRVWHLDPIIGCEWFKKDYPREYEYLEKHRYDVVEFTNEDLKELIDMYTNKLNYGFE